MQPNCAVALVQEPAQDEAVVQVLISLIGERQFDHWFRRNTRLGVVNQELVVYAASPFLQKWMQKQHRTVLAEAARVVIGPAAVVRFELDAGLSVSGSDSQIEVPASPAPLESTGISICRDAEPRPSSGSVPVQRQGRRFADLADLVVGDCNRLALTAVRQAAERADGAGGPLFIYGPVGSGKSHLLEGLYRDIRRANPALQVLFLTSEQFTNYFTQGLRDHSLPAFRQRFRTVDVLLVDDIDFLDGKRAVQEEFLHTFQQLESHGKLVVACGDRHPRLLTKISDELKTRFLSGMVCRLELPDLETRERIAISKAGRLHADLSPETLKFVARRFAGSVRELEGALHCLQVYHRMTGKRVGVSAAREVLEDLERDCLKVVRMADIERAVCEMFGVDAADLKSAGRTRSVSEPRMLAMYLARRHTRAAYSEIGQYFGGRNHATVISADRKVAAWLDQNLQVKVASQSWRLKDVLETLEQQLLAG